MRPLGVLVGLAIVAADLGGAGAAPLALVGAEIRAGTGVSLTQGTVLIDGETIAAVGPDVAVPDDAARIDLGGRILTPGFVAADTQIGLVEVGLEPRSNDASPRVAHPIRAAARADDGYDPRSTLIPVARRHGITSVVSAPGGGLVSGRGGWFDLLDPSDPGAQSPMRALVSLHVRLGEAGAAAVGGSRTLAMGRLREFFEDVTAYRFGQASFRRRDLYRLSAGRHDLEAAIPALSGKMPVVMEVHRASDIRAALRLAESSKLKVILLGVSEGWLVAGDIAESGVPVIVDPLASLPSRFEARNARPDNAALLARAGVKVILTRRSSHDAGNLRFVVGNALRAGFPRALAIPAITSVPAEAFGLGDELGRIEQGAAANLVVWTGDPFEPSSYAERVYVRGRAQALDSRQTRLAERYARRLGLIPAPAP